MWRLLWVLALVRGVKSTVAGEDACVPAQAQNVFDRV